MFDPISIPIVALSIPIVAIVTRHKRRMVELRIREVEAGAVQGDSATAAQVRALEERVRVLERIVTDKSYDVAAQIEALRSDGAGILAAEALARPELRP